MTCLYVSYAPIVRRGGLIAFSSHSSSHWPSVCFVGSTNSPWFASFSSSASFVSACFRVPLHVTHFCSLLQTASHVLPPFFLR
jgi:hypothetical protein